MLAASTTGCKLLIVSPPQAEAWGYQYGAPTARSPGLILTHSSLDRLELKIHGKSSLLVSPKRKKKFVDALLATNPLIKAL